MKIAYFDCFSGISGDMCLGALIGAGVDFEQLKEELAKLPVKGYALRREKVKRNGITAVNVFVDLLEVSQPERHLADIYQIITDNTLPEEVKEKSKAVFNRLAVAEAAVHDTTPDCIHFHEVGAVDAIVDVVGTVLGLHLLGVDKVYSSPLPMGKGFIQCMHGIIPSPAPATLEILQNVPIYGADIGEELVTPTGAALISTLTEAFTEFPALTVEKISYGAGKKVMEHPNLLRLIIGKPYESRRSGPIPCHGRHDHGPRHDNNHVQHGPGHKHGHMYEHGHLQDGKCITWVDTDAAGQSIATAVAEILPGSLFVLPPENLYNYKDWVSRLKENKNLADTEQEEYLGEPETWDKLFKPAKTVCAPY
ncbi:nickel pincer cofactor biosynthesis protein LarC [Desulfoscipio geothermicus]|uniref:Nickel insertion protein n=1 Tax=Desulfoscipio geothermicus DSM 3669 TaxID=1121426 RepID=A0A1I6DQZ0_9FIRM|nr:nickel pincer cofactor biosynthesis protein LarC [Desulfoscipio geothermicus]SFR07855.1 hypothetical protein SAMN05660706_11556 [Desulfoscipio geothermicus DSM 3669]